jgi:hypothetical protein
MFSSKRFLHENSLRKKTKLKLARPNDVGWRVSLDSAIIQISEVKTHDNQDINAFESSLNTAVQKLLHILNHYSVIAKVVQEMFC